MAMPTRPPRGTPLIPDIDELVHAYFSKGGVDYYARSTDDGETWTVEVLANKPENDVMPCPACGDPLKPDGNCTNDECETNNLG